MRRTIHQRERIYSNALSHRRNLEKEPWPNRREMRSEKCRILSKAGMKDSATDSKKKMLDYTFNVMQPEFDTWLPIYEMGMASREFMPTVEKMRQLLVAAPPDVHTAEFQLHGFFRASICDFQFERDELRNWRWRLITGVERCSRGLQ